MAVTEQTLTDSKNRWHGRLVLLGIVLFFIAPLWIVLGMKWVNYQPGGKSHGVLIQPPRKIDVHVDWSLPQHAGIVNHAQTVWNERWNIVVVAEHCNDTCLKQLHLVRQVHVSLAKEIDRVQRVLVTTQASVEAIQRDYPDLIVLNTPLEMAQRTLSQFGVNPKQPQNGVYLVDPLGNLVMFYPVNLEGKGLRSDVMKLLKFSWAG